MAAIDDKVVAMSFENDKFETGAKKTLSTLDRLKKALNFSGAGKGLDQISSSANKVDLSHVSNGVDTIRRRLSLMQVAARAVFASVAVQAFYAGTRMIKSLTLDPILQGFQEYETKLGAVQTILSNTAASGTKLQDVNKALALLNRYADKTIYNFTEMTKNIGTFTAAGVDLKTAVASIKGIANLAALSGSNSQQASTAMYQLSQAISAGRVSLQDWNSVVNAGMGGTIFQRALAQTAVHMGALNQSALKLTGSMKNVTINGQSFRQSIQASPGKQSWLTGKVLTQTLAQLSGNLTDAQLKAQGYSDAQVKAIQKQAKAALAAATQVKTLSQLIDTTKEAIGSGWANTFEIIFGNFGQAKVLFTGMSNSINNFVQRSSRARNQILKDWKALGGRTLLLDSLGKLAQNIGAVLKPIKNAFRDIFPRKTGAQLFTMTQNFSHFVDTLKPAPATIENLRRTFRGLFAAFDIVRHVVVEVVGLFGRLIGAAGVGSGGILNFTGGIGDFITSLDKAIKTGTGFHNFFVTLGNILAKPLHVLGMVAHAIGHLFSGFNVGALGGLGGLSGVFAGLGKALGGATTSWHNFLNNAISATGPFLQSVGNAFSKIGDVIRNALSSINWGVVLGTASVGIGAGFLLLFRKIFKGFSVQDLGEGIIGKLTGPFEALTGSITTMQRNIKAQTMLEIAGAIGILAASILALSTIKSKDLDKALSGLGIAFAELLGAMKVLDSIGKDAGFLKIPIIAGGLVILAIAIGGLVLSVKSLSKLDWNSLAKGLGGVSVLLGGIAIASGPLSRNSAGMITAGIGMTAIAVAMKILASAVKSFGSLSLETLAKGIGAVAASLVTIGLASRLFPPGLPILGAGLIIVGAGLKVLGSAIGQLGKLNVATLAKGIVSIGAALVVLAGAMRLMPPGLALQATGLGLISIALQGIAHAVVKMGALSFTEIARGLTALAGSLGILAIGLRAMTGTLAGSAALAVASAGMLLLAPALKIMGSMSWIDIAKGMVVLAGAMGILGVAGLALGPVAPAILALGVALLAIGGALALAGIGIAAVGAGLSLIAVAGPKAIEILARALTAFISKVPAILEAFGEGLVRLVVKIGEAAPKMVEAFGKIIVALANAVIKAAPKIAQAFGVLVVSALNVLHNHFPQLVRVGFEMIVSLLKGINSNITRIVNVGSQIIVRFLSALAQRAGGIIAAGANFIIHFMAGLARNLPRILAAGATVVVKFLQGVANNIVRVVGAGANVLIQFLNGLARKIPAVVASAGAVIISFLLAVGKETPKVIAAGVQMIINFLNGMADAIRNKTQDLINAGINIGSAITEGIGRGIGSSPGGILKTIGSFGKGLIEGFTSVFGIASPSKVMTGVGRNLMEGLAVGISNTGVVIRAARTVARSLARALESMFGSISGSINTAKIGTAFANIIRIGLASIRGGTPAIIGAGAELAQALGNAVSSSSGRISNAMSIVMASLLGAITSRTAQIIASANNVMIAFIRGISSLDSKVTLAGIFVVVSFLKGITNNVGKVLSEAQTIVTRMAQTISNNASKLISSGVTAVARFNLGIGQSLGRVVAMGSTIIGSLIAGLGNSIGALTALGIGAMASFLGGVGQTLSGANGTAYGEGLAFGTSLANGMVDGIKIMAGVLAATATSTALGALNAAKQALGIKSPSKEFMKIGQYMIEGLVLGITGTPGAEAAVTTMANHVMSATVIAFKKKIPREYYAIFRDLGQYVVGGFRDGLLGIATPDDPVTQAVKGLSDKIVTQIRYVVQKISNEQDRLNSLLHKKKKTKGDLRMISDLRESLKSDNAVLNRLQTINHQLITGLTKEKDALRKATDDYAKVSAKLDEANQNLADAIQTRNDAISSYTDQFSALPDLVTNKATQLPRYLISLRQQINDTRKYAATLAKLRKLGLDDATYKKLLDEGPADQAFADQILAGGKKAVTHLNSMDAELLRISRGIGKSAAHNLYDAGVQAAQGIVDGLQSKLEDLKKVMRTLAHEIVTTIRKELKIKSPSEAFAEIGSLTIDGLAKGINNNSGTAITEVNNLAKKMQESMSKIPEAFNKMADIEPRITPILDLSNVKRDAVKMGGILSGSSIGAATSIRHASAVSIPVSSGKDSAASQPGAVTFEQNNYSPKALSEVEIYRQTRNQLSLARRTLEERA